MPQDAPGPRTVLYVEDHGINALLMQALFERRDDLHLELAGNCAEALACAELHPPDLLLLDLRLPDGHGSTLLPRLRALPGMQRVPAIAVTAEETTLAQLPGFDALWPKPLRLAQVLAELQQRLPARTGRLAQGVPDVVAGWAACAEAGSPAARSTAC